MTTEEDRKKERRNQYIRHHAMRYVGFKTIAENDENTLRKQSAQDNMTVLKNTVRAKYGEPAIKQMIAVAGEISSRIRANQLKRKARQVIG